MDDDADKKVAIEADIAIIAIILFLIAAVPASLAFLKVYFGGYSGTAQTYWNETLFIVKQVFNILTAISFPVSLFLLIGIIYCVEQLKHIRRKEALMFNTKVELAEEPVGAGNPALTNRWQDIKTHIVSENPNDWKQAILEADIILESILTSLGYRGEGIGEKLKRVLPGEMKSLNEAWEAHKVRNAIAHEGSSYPLTQHEAQKVINMYKKVFEEFYYI